jgi:hypothetical protein
MTAFKSDGAMHLRGKAAKNWVTKIKKEKAEQDKVRKAKAQTEQNGAASQ